jgi:drug/metabolite transporter (DMT)-like permease
MTAMKNDLSKQLFGLFLATIFISTSGVLGRYIDMPTEVIVWFRSFIGMIFLYFFCSFKNISLKFTDRKDIPSLVVSSLFLGAHWVTYSYRSVVFVYFPVNNSHVGALVYENKI